MIFHFANEVMAHHSKRGRYENIKTETNLLNHHEATKMRGQLPEIPICDDYLPVKFNFGQ